MYKSSSSWDTVAKSKWSHLKQKKSFESETEIQMNKLQRKVIAIIPNLS